MTTLPPVVADYRKDTAHPPGHGYGWKYGSTWKRGRPTVLDSVVIHTMNNPNKGTKFANECKFLRDSPDVSAHEAVGKDGTVAIILPASEVAWHAGTAREEFHNFRSYGIELHVSVGETPTQAQIDSLTWSVRGLVEKHGIRKEHIETHRAVALPKGRKTDPEGWGDVEFYLWRDSLFEPDWKKEWGPQPYHHEWGIPTRWREEYRAGRHLGKALTDGNEMLLIDGRKLIVFEHGAILWSPSKSEVWR